MEETEKTLLDVECLSGPVPYPLVEVVWADACGDNGWDMAEKEYDEELCLTVGFLIHHNDHSAIVASTLHTGVFGTNARIQIPIGMIKHIKEL